MILVKTQFYIDGVLTEANLIQDYDWRLRWYGSEGEYLDIDQPSSDIVIANRLAELIELKKGKQ